MAEIDLEKTLICPYNDSHLIRISKFQRHLIKCEKQHPHIILDVCPYNASHRIKPELLKVRRVGRNIFT